MGGRSLFPVRVRPVAAVLMIIILFGSSQAFASDDPEGDEWERLFPGGDIAASDHAQPLAWSMYGEHHLNGVEGEQGEYADVHRLVLGFGYRFADWIRLTSELELEHGFVEEGQGELSLEQLHVSLLLHRAFNLRMGRVLVPAAKINLIHEPPTFHGVERPFFERYIIPTTWSADGIGAFGRLANSIRYEAYLLNGLDAGGFSPDEGIRGGRMKERPGFTDPAASARVEVTLPAAGFVRAPAFAVFGYYGGGGSANKGEPSGYDPAVTLAGADFSARLAMFELRAAAAHGIIEQAGDLPDDVAEQITGYRVEAAIDLLPEALRSGRLDEAELFLFVRHERFDTQYVMPENVDGDGRNNRSALTAGVTFLPVPQLALKADWQLLADAAGSDLPYRINLGFGWMF
ncbi:MAG: hypothetical protein MAG453_02096 [Calditrichaeota bacterium]|nr:hypothetical protein [Calditrichota bacterium]